MTEKHITSTANPVVKMLRSLSQKKYREETGLFIVEGLRHVEGALTGGMLPAMILFSPRAEADSATQGVIRQAEAGGADIIRVTDEILGKITDRDNAQPVIGAFRQRYAFFDAVQTGLWVGLEDIRDPGNLGTIIRTSAATGVSGILLVGDTCDIFSPETIRASMGSFARIAVVRATVAEYMVWRKSWKGQVVGTHVRTENDYRTVSYARPLLLMMGSEQAGLSEAVSGSCDMLVKIPMAGAVESLNVAVATAVMLYEIAGKDLKITA